MPIGFGLTPVGLSDAGFGAVDTAVGPAATILVGVNSGISRDARLIDPQTRQYVFDSHGRTRGMRSVQQKVLLACLTVRGSSAMGPSFGNAVSLIDRVGDDIERRVADAYQQALKPLVDAQAIAIASIDVFLVKQGALYDAVRWIDLTTGIEQTTTV